MTEQIDGLTVKQQQLLFLLNPYNETPVTYKEAAIEMGISEMAVKHMMMRIKERSPFIYEQFKKLKKEFTAGQKAIDKAVPMNQECIEHLQDRGKIKERW